MIDFTRFYPPKDVFEKPYGFDRVVVFKPASSSSNLRFPHERVIEAVMVDASDPEELKRKLRKVRGDKIVGVSGGSISVFKEAVMRRKVDIILDSADRELDYATLKLAVEKDVAVEFGLRKFLHTQGFRRMKLFERLKDEIKSVRKLGTPFVISTSATSSEDLRTRKQVETFFSFFGLDVERARSCAVRIVRRYCDPSYVMDGFEIEVNDGCGDSENR